MLPSAEGLLVLVSRSLLRKTELRQTACWTRAACVGFLRLAPPHTGRSSTLTLRPHSRFSRPPQPTPAADAGTAPWGHPDSAAPGAQPLPRHARSRVTGYRQQLPQGHNRPWQQRKGSLRGQLFFLKNQTRSFLDQQKSFLSKGR